VSQLAVEVKTKLTTENVMGDTAVTRVPDDFVPKEW
jgi:hypothetical protein